MNATVTRSVLFPIIFSVLGKYSILQTDWKRILNSCDIRRYGLSEIFTFIFVFLYFLFLLDFKGHGAHTLWFSILRIFYIYHIFLVFVLPYIVVKWLCSIFITETKVVTPAQYDSLLSNKLKVLMCTVRSSLALLG